MKKFHSVEYFIKDIKTYETVENLFTFGFGYEFAKILKNTFQDSKIYFDTECKHYITKIEDKFYDITGDLDIDEVYENKYLEKDESPIALPPIWENSYVQKLGIIDHCQEVLDLYRINKIAKRQEIALEKEMMDLFLILDAWKEGKENLLQERLLKFEENRRKDKR